MAITNDPTGRVSTCEHCGKKVEEARLLKGMRLPIWVGTKARDVLYEPTQLGEALAAVDARFGEA